MRPRVLTASILATTALLAIACGKDGDKTQVNSETVVIPKGDGKSALFEVPLPAGATVVSSEQGMEVYRAQASDRLVDMQRFFDKEMAGKPFRGYDWCGGSSDYANTQLRILWRKAGSNDLFTVLVDSTDPAGLLITLAEEPGAPEVQCPPGPIDEIPNYDPGDIPGV